MIGDDESTVPSGIATPQKDAGERQSEEDDLTKAGPALAAAVASKVAQTGAEDPLPPQQRSEELPTEVRVKLRKLDRLESRYQDLLKAYRIAHARVSLIEPFEASLRENTPFASIGDPQALVEYLNQTTLKGEMVLDELRRVASERDDYKRKFQQSEMVTLELKDEVTRLKDQRQDPVVANGAGDLSARPSLEVATGNASKSDAPEAQPTVKSPTPSTSSRVSSFSLFSPKTKAAKSPPLKETTEEFFSYDTELPRLESDLAERQTEIDSLTKQVQTLKGDLSVTRESTESMVQSLEAATRELHSLRDWKEKFESTKGDLQDSVANLQNKIRESESWNADLQKQIDDLQKDAAQKSDALETANDLMVVKAEDNRKTRVRMEESERAAEDLREKLFQKDATVKDLEDSLAMAQSARRQEAKTLEKEASSEKRIETLQNILESLRAQLKSTETTVAELRSELQVQQDAFEKRPSRKLLGMLGIGDGPEVGQIETRQDALDFISRKFGSNKQQGENANRSEDAENGAVQDPTATGAGKKKNKKKKKTKGGQAASAEPAFHDAPVKVTEDLGDADEDPTKPEESSDATHMHLEEQITNLRTELDEKKATIDRLTSQLREKELLKEEIETLRDDLLHQGEEHVEARDALKLAIEEKDKLRVDIQRLETELVQTKSKTDGAADSEQAHKDLEAKFDELKIKTSTLQTDLAAAEQLAAARFKDITDLRELLSKAQPELRNLRNEVQVLKSTKDELRDQTAELRRLESRHEDLKAEIKGLGKRIGDKDSEIKDLQRKVEQETSARSKAENDLGIAQSDLRHSEAGKQEAVEASNQTSRELTKAKEEATALRARVSGLEDQISNHSKQVSDLREEISLKAALHASSQSLLQGLRDQTHELSIQAREATSRAESLEEELADAQRMLSERTREGETMRRLLNDAETKTESKIREMRERMENALEERDRAEDEASSNARRLAREMEDLKTKSRDAARVLKLVEDEKEELVYAQRDWKRRRDELESANEKFTNEVGEVRAAMVQLRDALDESERQAQELDVQKADLRRNGEEAQQRVEKLTKANKTLTEEVKTLQQNAKKGVGRPGAGLDSGVQSSRSSIDSPGPPRTNSAVGSPSPLIRDRMPNSRSETPTGPNAAGIDYVYLKNVLLQFLEQKDRNHQKQLIPVLGMLLHFDR